jgi:hypothetical protein
MNDFVKGAEVQVYGLERVPKYNGKLGQIIEVFPDNKVGVRLYDNDDIKVAPDKLKLIRSAGSMLLDAASASASAPASASASLRKIPVVLLGELHDDVRCGLKNTNILIDVIKNSLSKHEFLLVSEGRGVNPCYRALNLPRDRIIVEHPSSSQSKIEMLDKLLLTTDLLTNVLEGRYKQGTGAAAGRGIPDTVTINPQFFMDRAKDDGCWALLQAVPPNGIAIYEQMVAAAFSRDKQQFYSLFDVILNYLIDSDYLNDVSMSDQIKQRLQLFIITRNLQQFKELGNLFRSSRDEDIIRQVEEKAKSENSTLRVIVIIFGALHYDNLRKLIQQSPVLEFDSTKSSNIKFGGKKMKKIKKRISKSHHLTKKYNSKSKKYNSKSKKCKTHRK